MLQLSSTLARVARRVSPSRAVRAAFSTSPDLWETIQRRDGRTMYFNKVTKEGTFKNPFEAAPVTTPATAASPEAPAAATEATDLQEADNWEPIDFAKAARIEGSESQIVHIDIGPKQKLRTESGAMIYMTDGVEMDTTTAGGFRQGLTRMVTGQNFFVTEYTYKGSSKGTVAMGTSVPSKILHMRLDDFGGSLICQKGAFLCGSHTIGIEMEFTKNFGAGFFGGEGFILQRLNGPGDAFISANGALIERTLAPGEVLRISSGCLVAFEPSVHFDISRVGGVKNVLFSGTGLFVTTLTGPGRVYLQGLPFDRMVGEIASRIPGGGGGPIIMPMGLGGGSGAADAAGGAVAGDVAGGAIAGDGLDAPIASSPSDASMFGMSDAPPADAGFQEASGFDAPPEMDADPNEFVAEEFDTDAASDTVEAVTDFFKRFF
ncbi:hypothetical protein SPRG_00482 [Saprolegnia parasitica CBS 223.65]|uniref:WW domain-containing protein n=1 Tax=Saprolegnia parasitica (strain CBS 223.65) TaxID=695850 RepID=A0A067CYS4_SAPPC|nr:hypothetical protein SPRG_00482 [Saprolegnia parasitica CBS 223.65]KDO35638.1 hypothetical protein SPRG_00482 [Saprolegnia parasitica CBS 223.65]|eukprot:XP_012193966.1 hypothetical protein SPRG_00482 [Saprolegnia parasitica CBS 223.65]